ncbi:MAG: tetratricopeptide repeat protein [Verrucomicrobia bacterium]|nr:tetratricopeptide repeat protein [Verrucomicrobiota bacterium]MCH8511604.1 tetratricopeptide repeat protein [Kiritimatiellia bacterium]
MMNQMMKTTTLSMLKCCLALTFVFGVAHAQTESEADARSTAAVSRDELRARRMIESALELVRSGQHERGVSMLEAVGDMFPDSAARFRASLELARHHIESNQFDKAAAQLNVARNSRDEDEQAEAWFLTGRVNFQRANYNEAFSAFRRVINDFPASEFTNLSYDMIGQAHFNQGRWGKAVEAFQMVGTAVPESLAEADEVLAEAGQRLFVKVHDRDLRILSSLGEKSYVTIEAESGDKEEVLLTRLGRSGEDWIASIMMAPEPSEPNDGVLTVRGGEVVTVTYIDRNNAEGEVDVPITTQVRVVSTGAVAFTDGAYNRSVRGVFAGQPAYVRLVDLDLDVTPEPDEAEVDVIAYYKVEREVETTLPQEVDIDTMDEREQEDEWVERGRITLRLTETDNHSGEFRGQFRPVIAEFATGSDRELVVMPNDEIVLSYTDETHLRGDTPEERLARVQVVVGGSTEPQSIVSEANDANTQAQKLLIEAQLLHRWASIFDDVGLEESAFSKAEEGLDKVEEIMQLTARQSLNRELLEQSFAVRWDLYLVQGRLNEAIATCMALVELFPDTTLVDRAFMNIARARAEAGTLEEMREAIRVYRTVIDLPQSDYKAEAQFRIGEVTEDMIRYNLRPGTDPNFAPAMVEYQRCAEMYPHSPFAGESFNKIINFHITQRDYLRSVELMDRVMQDYPDAPWMDEILVKWGVVAFRMGNRNVAIQKFMQVLEEYPNGASAGQARNFLQRLQ